MTDRMKELEKAKEEVRVAIAKRGDKIPLKARSLVEEAIAKMKVDHLLPKDVLGFSPAAMELIYQQGYQLFQNGKYQDALIIFNTLRQLDLTDTRYTFAIAACYQNSKYYLDAAANYLIYQYMDPLNPVPCFHLYDCYLKANYPISALLALQEALVLAENSPKDAGLKEKILIELNHLEALLTEEFKEKYGSTP